MVVADPLSAVLRSALDPDPRPHSGRRAGTDADPASPVSRAAPLAVLISGPAAPHAFRYILIVKGFYGGVSGKALSSVKLTDSSGNARADSSQI